MAPGREREERREGPRTEPRAGEQAGEGVREGVRGGAQGGLRARKRARTWAAIQDAALGLFLERGYATTTIEEIAAAVEVSPRTVLRYFGSKEDVLFARERETVRTLGELLAERPPGEPVLAALQATLERVAAGYDAGRERYLAWARLVRGTPALSGAYLELLAGFEGACARFAAQRQGVPEGAARPRLQGAVVVAVFRVALQTWEAGVAGAGATGAADASGAAGGEAAGGEAPGVPLTQLVAEHLSLLEGDLWR